VRVRARSRGPARETIRSRRPPPLSAEPVAGVADPGPRSSTAATTFAHRSCWAGRVVLAIITLFIVSCANFASPPAITPALIANARPDHSTAKDLATGRNLFVSRCLECHALPSVTKHLPDEWPHLVSRMSGRANLSASDQSAIIAYLRAASVTRH
jgi:cytochrome c5